MTGSGWKPIQRLLDLERDIEETFSFLIDLPWGRAGRADWRPAVDIDETPEGYTVTADLPGVCAGDVELRVLPREIEICGTRVSSRSVASATRVQTERSVGRFSRRFHLAHAVDPRTAECRCQDGIYQVHVRKQTGEHDVNDEREGRDR